MHTHAGLLVERRCGPRAVSRPQALARGNRAAKPQAWACCLGHLGPAHSFTVAAYAGMAAANHRGVAPLSRRVWRIAEKRPVRIHCSGKWWCAQPMRHLHRVVGGKLPCRRAILMAPAVMSIDHGFVPAARIIGRGDVRCAIEPGLRYDRMSLHRGQHQCGAAFAMRHWRLHRAPAAIARHRSRWRLPRASARSCHRSKPLRSMRRHQAACAHRPRARPAPARRSPRRCTQWHRRSRSAGAQQRSDTRSAGPAESEYLPAQDHP